MKYIKSFERNKAIKNMTFDEILNYRKIQKYTPTEKLLHLIGDEIDEQWDIIKNRKDDSYSYSFSYKDFKKIPCSKIKKLLEEGADINADFNNWGSPIKLAVYRQDLNLIKCLLNNGANINGTNKDRNSSTPTYIAAGIDNHPTSAKILKYLIKNNADINIPNDGRVLPIQHALFREIYENATILLKAGSKLENGTYTFSNTTQRNDLNKWMKTKNYNFQKELCLMYPDEISKIDDDKIHDKIKEDFPYLFTLNKYNL